MTNSILNQENFVFGPGELGKLNQRLHSSALSSREKVEAQRQAHGFIASDSYPLKRLEIALADCLAAAGLPRECNLAFVERGKFGADFAVTVRSLLSAPGGAGAYIKQHVPQILAAIQNCKLAREGQIVSVEAKGMYVNLKMSASYFLNALEPVLTYGGQYGEGDAWRGKSIVVDYSSPNAAKKLHAGHIRSTIVGEILCNLYEANGATAHRLNHINDLGGFGFLLEGYRRWEKLLPSTELQNDRLAALYQLYRTLEKCAALATELASWDAASQETVQRCFGQVTSRAQYQQAWADYVKASNARYEALEAGDSTEVALWQKMVGWSLEDFKSFYDILGIRHDYVIGESFYAASGLKLLEAARAAGVVLTFSQSLADAEIARLRAAHASEEMTEQELESALESVTRDVGASVVMFPDHSRLVVLRSDGRTIYATRDLAAIMYRALFFKPSRVIYVVGQEQQEHFRPVFEAAAALGIKGETELVHTSFGFYVDAGSKKKLSSRDGASNVHRLLGQTVAHFEAKLLESGEIPAAEARESGRQLGVGSIIINDVKKTRKSSVEVFADLNKAVEEFEKSGGAYLMYSACRARSILRKYGGELPKPSSLSAAELLPVEAELVKKLMEFPNRVRAAAEQDEPSLMVSLLIEICILYNTYYNAAPVIKGGEVHLHRVALTAAVAQVIENGLQICHITCPPRI
ncbi:MAG: arginine--tRNA ligase [Oligoflexia bacterium]|nr:arginine--tRNA ligase [Oligoflexia bacterium]